MDNGRTKVTLEFDVSDLPMLAEALAIQRNTALMCGRRGAMKRLEALRRMVEELVPEAARVFDGEAWSEICLALYEGHEWSVEIARAPWRHEWDPTGHIEVRVGDKSWRSREPGHRREDPAFAKVVKMLHELEPLRPAAALR